MVGYDSGKLFGKPSRSEELATPEELEEHVRKVRAYLEAKAPKRMLMTCLGWSTMMRATGVPSLTRLSA
jgi:hypothetical protein